MLCLFDVFLFLSYFDFSTLLCRDSESRDFFENLSGKLVESLAELVSLVVKAGLGAGNGGSGESLVTLDNSDYGFAALRRKGSGLAIDGKLFEVGLNGATLSILRNREKNRINLNEFALAVGNREIEDAVMNDSDGEALVAELTDAR